jgi:hypothetical protein
MVLLQAGHYWYTGLECGLCQGAGCLGDVYSVSELERKSTALFYGTSWVIYPTEKRRHRGF